MSEATLRGCILAAARDVEAALDELCQLDAIAGDGDHGVTMALAARAVRLKLEANPDKQGAELLSTVALAMGSVGGAIGPLYATALLQVAAAVRTQDSPFGEPTLAQLRAYAETAAQAITSLGHAKPGDKTIIDAIVPSIAALQGAEIAGTSVVDALGSAVAAARAGAESTADMIATLGRASRLGERSRGSVDPGASSFVIILDALVRTYRGEAAGHADGV